MVEESELSVFQVNEVDASAIGSQPYFAFVFYQVHHVIVGQRRIFGGVAAKFLSLRVVAMYSSGIEGGKDPTVGCSADTNQQYVGVVGNIRFQLSVFLVIDEDTFTSGSNHNFPFFHRNHFFYPILDGECLRAFGLQVGSLFQFPGSVIVEVKNILASEQDSSFDAEG